MAAVIPFAWTHVLRADQIARIRRLCKVMPGADYLNSSLVEFWNDPAVQDLILHLHVKPLQLDIGHIDIWRCGQDPCLIFILGDLNLSALFFGPDRENDRAVSHPVPDLLQRRNVVFKIKICPEFYKVTVCRINGINCLVQLSHRVRHDRHTDLRHPVPKDHISDYNRLHLYPPSLSGAPGTGF